MKQHNIRVISKSEMFILTKSTNANTGKFCYTVEVNRISRHDSVTAHAMRNHFDPAGNRGGKYSLKWKYRNLKTAQTLLFAAMLKFG